MTRNITKHHIIAEVAQRTRLRKHDVQRVLEAILDYQTEVLLAGNKIELQDYWVLDVQAINRKVGAGVGHLRNNGKPALNYKKLTVRASKRLRDLLKN